MRLCLAFVPSSQQLVLPCTELCFLAIPAAASRSLQGSLAVFLQTNDVCQGFLSSTWVCVCRGRKGLQNLPNRLLLFFGVRKPINQVFRPKTHFDSSGEQRGVLHMVTVCHRALSLYGKLGLVWELVGIHNLQQGVVCHSSPLCHGHAGRAGP